MLQKSKKKVDSPATKAVISLLDKAAKQYGLSEVRRAANRWASGQRDKLRLAKQRAALERELAEVNKRLGG